MDSSEIYSKRLNAKEVIFPKQGEIIFPIADGRIKTLGGDQELRTSTLIRDHPIRGDGQRDFLGESEGSPPSPPVEEFLSSGGPSSSAAVRVVVVHDIKEEESERQKEVQEVKRNEERENEEDGEVGERVTQRAHETWR